MKAGEFIKRREMISREGERCGWWKRRALKRLMIEARAVPVMVERRIVGHRISSGEVVCEKRRYQNEAQAISALVSISQAGGANQKPIRQYLCPHCQGWHLTSSPR